MSTEKDNSLDPMTEESSDQASVARTKKKRPSSLIVLWIVVFLMAAALVYMFWINSTLRQPEVQNKIADEANQELVAEVSKIILVPTDEDPTLAKIVNVENLKKTNPEFYGSAQDGDRLIIYSSTAIIYRESEGKIINVAPVIVTPSDQEGLEQSGAETQPTEETPEPEASQ